MKVALDALGGDLAPVEQVKGALLAAEEFGPPADLRGDSLLAGELLVHALSEKDSGLEKSVSDMPMW